MSAPALGARVRNRATFYRQHARAAWPSTREWALDRRHRGALVHLDEEQLRAARRSDTVFILGSGKSILDISPEEWEAIGRHDTIGFNQFARQQTVRVGFHMVGELKNVEETAEFFRTNPFYRDTIYLLQEGWRAEKSNELVGRRLMAPGTKVFRYRRRARGRYEVPSERLADGLVHGWNTSICLTNLALLLGWRRIVYTGIDLYNREYFWMPWGERRLDDPADVRTSDAFPLMTSIVEMLGAWRPLLEQRGVAMEVHNPESALAAVLPVFDRSSLCAPSA